MIEPWKPRVGQRVRVRLDGTCQHRQWAWMGIGTNLVSRAHEAAEDGLTGVVYQFFTERDGDGDEADKLQHSVETGHRFEVEFDSAGRPPGLPRAMLYTASELEPV